MLSLNLPDNRTDLEIKIIDGKLNDTSKFLNSDKK